MRPKRERESRGFLFLSLRFLPRHSHWPPLPHTCCHVCGRERDINGSRPLVSTWPPLYINSQKLPTTYNLKGILVKWDGCNKACLFRARCHRTWKVTVNCFKKGEAQDLYLDILSPVQPADVSLLDISQAVPNAYVIIQFSFALCWKFCYGARFGSAVPFSFLASGAKLAVELTQWEKAIKRVQIKDFGCTFIFGFLVFKIKQIIKILLIIFFIYFILKNKTKIYPNKT